jgi:Virulence factor membrane-bound polymerase, C-terminal/O-Antigen ligase
MRGVGVVHIIAVCTYALVILLPMHNLPVQTFWQEWLLFASMVILILQAVSKSKFVLLRLDGVSGLLLCIAGLACMQGVMGVAHWSAVSMELVYVVFAWLAYQFGAVVVADGLAAQAVPTCAWAFLFAAILSCVCAGLQLLNVVLPFDLLFPPAGGRVYANLAQANHFNDLMWLGAVSALFLKREAKLSAWLAWFCIVVMLVFSVFSASRLGIAFALAVALVPLATRVANSERLSRALTLERDALAVFLVYCAAFFFFEKFKISEYFGYHGLVSRWAGGADVRLALWSNLWPHLPAFGVGVGNFKLLMLDQADIWLHTGFPAIPEHAHNLLLDLAVEFGWVFTSLFVMASIYWLRERLFRPVTSGRIWAFGVVAIVAIHALFEYPLNYAFFLLPLSFVLGILAVPEKSYCMHLHVQKCVVPALLAMLLVLFFGLRQFEVVSDVFFRLQFGLGYTEQDKVEAFEKLDSIPSVSPFYQYAGLTKAMMARPSDIRHGRIQRDCEQVERLWLAPSTLINCAASYRLSAQVERADALLSKVCRMRPESRLLIKRMYLEALSSQAVAMPLACE